MKTFTVLLTMLCVSCLAVGCAMMPQIYGNSSNGFIYKALGNGLIGDSMAQIPTAQRKYALDAEYKALEYTRSNNSINWSASDGSAAGVVIPSQPYRVGSQNCRQYSHSFMIRGVPQTNRGSACRNEDGSWSPLT